MKRVWLPVAVLLLLLLVLLLVPLWLSCDGQDAVVPVVPDTRADVVEDEMPLPDVARVERERTETPPTEGEAEPAAETRDVEPELPRVSIMLSPHGAELDATRIRVQGRAVTPDGEPVAGQRVQSVASLSPYHELRSARHRSEPAALYSRTQTAADGRFELEVLAATPFLLRLIEAQDGSSLTPTADQILLEQTVQSVPEDWTVVVEPPLEFVGTVVDVEGKPVASALVQVSRGDALELFRRPTWMPVDDAGRFRFTAAPGLHVRVSGRSQSDDLRGWRHVYDSGEFELVLRPRRTFLLRVLRETDAGEWEELREGGAAFELRDRGAADSVDVSWDAEAGCWRGALATADRIRVRPFVRVSTADRLSAEVRVPQDAPEPVIARLHRASSVRVRLVDLDGEPVTGARVTVEAYRSDEGGLAGGLTSARSDADGVAVVPGVVPLDDEARLRVHVGERVRNELTFTTEAAGRTADLGTITMGPATSIQGRVHDADGAPIAGIAVAAARRAPDSHWELSDRLMGSGDGLAAITGDDGSFRIDGITAGLWDVVAWTRDRPMATALGLSIDTGETVVELRMARTTPVLGVLVDDDGRPIGGRELEVLVDHPVDIALMETVTTDENGGFRYDGFDARTERVWVEVTIDGPDEDGGYRTAGAYVRPGERAVLRLGDLEEFDPEAHDKRRGR